MDPINLFNLVAVPDPRPGEIRMAFHFTRKPESSIQEPRLDDVMRAYDFEVTKIMYTKFEEMLTLYVFTAGYDWTAHKQETLKICEEKKIDRDWRLMRMVMSACVDNTECGMLRTSLGRMFSRIEMIIGGRVDSQLSLFKVLSPSD
ncbi:hypothetical protein FANTH_6109 [Fusarium anthophilum]|uniref:Uncharacterized protein n=1 Tax=Fusarium anthophilum TaxID=48485 RepID=A0A8H5E5M2_9HYPO|nr:hypothetical protein FANTH_6109 [Fusarium anthophilum]